MKRFYEHVHIPVLVFLFGWFLYWFADTIKGKEIDFWPVAPEIEKTSKTLTHSPIRGKIRIDD